MKNIFFAFFIASGLLVSCGGGNKDSDSKENKNDSSETSKSPETKAPEIKADNMEPKEVCKNNLTALFALIEKGDYKTAAPMIAYRGADKDRKWKSGCDYSNAEEKSYVDKMCAKIKGINRDVKKMDWENFSQETESEGEWNVWKVSFSYNDDTDQSIIFAFLKIDNSYLLGDIDS